jgi:hypothetical protein
LFAEEKGKNEGKEIYKKKKEVRIYILYDGES